MNLNRFQNSDVNREPLSRNKYVLIHHYLETDHYSILGFSNSRDDLVEVRNLHPCFGSSRHDFVILVNTSLFSRLNDVKDYCLINICKNVAEYLSVGEYAMLKNSYYKSSAWFEKAKNSASLGADILYNY